MHACKQAHTYTHAEGGHHDKTPVYIPGYLYVPSPEGLSCSFVFRGAMYLDCFLGLKRRLPLPSPQPDWGTGVRLTRESSTGRQARKWLFERRMFRPSSLSETQTWPPLPYQAEGTAWDVHHGGGMGSTTKRAGWERERERERERRERERRSNVCFVLWARWNSLVEYKGEARQISGQWRVRTKASTPFISPPAGRPRQVLPQPAASHHAVCAGNWAFIHVVGERNALHQGANRKVTRRRGCGRPSNTNHWERCERILENACDHTPPHTHTHTHTHKDVCMHACTHARTHTHEHAHARIHTL